MKDDEIKDLRDSIDELTDSIRELRFAVAMATAEIASLEYVEEYYDDLEEEELEDTAREAAKGFKAIIKAFEDAGLDKKDAIDFMAKASK